MRDKQRVNLFRKSKRTYRSIALRAEADVKSVWDAMHGRIKRPRASIAAAISEALDTPVEVLFPALAEDAA